MKSQIELACKSDAHLARSILIYMNVSTKPGLIYSLGMTYMKFNVVYTLDPRIVKFFSNTRGI